MSYQFQEEALLEVQEKIDEPKNLVVFNDDYNTFEHVIETLIRVCRHSVEQAEQCTLIIHHRGKCSVKKGSMTKLKPMKEAICDVGIDARVL
jgi:ATP-dependent Clp protease adaptor protein ClpS